MQIFVKKYCEENHLLFETTKLIYEDKFTESIAREKRYQFFEHILEKYQSSYLFTAHHGDDLIETMMMRIVRGSSLKGISGISKSSKRSFYTIVRPLLYATKEDIYQYVKDNHIPFVEDSSNQDNHYTRNRYRKNLLPFLKAENKKVHLKFLECSEELQEVLNYIEKVVEKKYNQIVIDGKLNWIALLKEEEFLQKEKQKTAAGGLCGRGGSDGKRFRSVFERRGSGDGNGVSGKGKAGRTSPAQPERGLSGPADSGGKLSHRKEKGSRGRMYPGFHGQPDPCEDHV